MTSGVTPSPTTPPAYATQGSAETTQQATRAVENLSRSTAELSASLAQLKHTKSHPRPTSTTAILNQIERLTSSIARLIEAFVKLKDSLSTPKTGAEAPATSTTDSSTVTETTTTDPSSADLSSIDTSVSQEQGAIAEPSLDTTTDSADPITTTTDQQSTTPYAVDQSSETSADTALNNLLMGPPDLSSLPLPTTPVAKTPMSLGSPLPRSGDFLWKPVSDKDGKLAILLPSSYTGKVKSVKILNASGTHTLQKGVYSGVGNGDREHFRFSKPGASFPDGAIVLITMKDGSTKHITIKDTGKRTTV